jgi:hypothetical protein
MQHLIHNFFDSTGTGAKPPIRCGKRDYGRGGWRVADRRGDTARKGAVGVE